MPLFSRNKEHLHAEPPTVFSSEKELQTLIETNLESIFSCRLVASEFRTGQRHGGRIDTLALSEDGNPVIIEYKVLESSDLVNQSLFYLSWIRDHKGDFQVAVNESLGETEIDWSDVRVLCIAPGYKKYDLHAVRVMGANIELWQYRLYENGCLYLDEVFRRHEEPGAKSSGKNPVMVEAGKKAAITRKTTTYSIDDHLGKPEGELSQLMDELREFTVELGDDVEEVAKKFYIAYKVTQNFLCIEAQKRRILLYLKLIPREIEMPEFGRDVTDVGHYGTGHVELSIVDQEQIPVAQSLIKSAYLRVGG